MICNLVAATDDAEALVLERTPTTITVMNLYPYGSGHLMVAPMRHVASYDDLTDDENVALARAQRARAAGDPRRVQRPTASTSARTSAGPRARACPGTCTCTCCPRWSGDTNFMTAVAEARVLPESLRDRLRQAESGLARGSVRAVDRTSDAADAGDELPEDLDVTAYVGPYVFPDIKRRRIAGTIYPVHRRARACGPGSRPTTAGCCSAAVLLLLDRGVPLRRGLAAARSTRPRRSRSRAARSGSRSGTRRRSSRGAGCSVAARRGASSLYSADEPPSIRGLVELDAVDGHVLGEYTEHNPEDWSSTRRW